jgi:YVTN family beta-propeller protein
MRRGRVRVLALARGALLVVILAGGVIAARVLAAPASPVVRTVAVGMNPNGVAIDAQSNRVFVTNRDDDSVSVLDAANGRVLRTVPLTGQPTLVAVDARTGRAFVVIQQPTSSGQLSSVAVLDARTGRPLRTVPVCDDANALAIDEGTSHIFITNNDDDNLSVLDAANGRVLRQAGPVGYNLNTGYYPTGYYPLAVAVDAPLGHVFTANFNNNSVSMLDARTGRLLRVVPVIPGPSHLAVDERAARVFVASAGQNTIMGSVSTLDAASGTVLRTVTVGNGVPMLAVNERAGRLFAFDYGGNVTVLDTRTGAPVGRVALGVRMWTAMFGWRQAVDVDVAPRRGAPNGRVLVLVRPGPAPVGPRTGAVWILDGRTGRPLRLVPVGVAPSALAVDVHSGRVFVINSNQDLWSGPSVPTPTSPTVWGWVPRPIRRLVTTLLPRPTATPNPVSTFGTVSILDTIR